VTRGPLGVAVFASGGGTNFQALLDHQRADSPWRIVLLVANREAGAVERARAAGVPVAIIPTKDRTPAEVADESLEVLDIYGVDVIALAGYLRLLPARLVARYRGRIVNIHPALLPEFGGEGMYGMNVHRAVLAAGSTVTGATVHFVEEEFDQGAILAQERVPMQPGDTPEDVAARVLAVEHRLYGRALDHLCASLLADRPVEPLESEGREESRPDIHATTSRLKEIR
jgi:phosphoribosylglycinamide formyltransferase-1